MDMRCTAAATELSGLIADENPGDATAAQVVTSLPFVHHGVTLDMDKKDGRYRLVMTGQCTRCGVEVRVPPRKYSDIINFQPEEHCYCTR